MTPVEVHWANSALHLTVADPVMAYAKSMSAFLTMTDSESVDTVDRVRRRVTDVVPTSGELSVTTSVACFVCRP